MCFDSGRSARHGVFRCRGVAQHFNRCDANAVDAMQLGVMTIDLYVRQSQSLKDKRRVVKALKERLRAKYNISIAEIDHQDSKKQATIALAMIGSDAAYVQGALESIRKELFVVPDAEVGRIEIEYL